MKAYYKPEMTGQYNLQYVHSMPGFVLLPIYGSS